MKYVLKETLFKKILSKQGFNSVFDFSKKTAIHRNTILSYLYGKDVFSSSFKRIADILKEDPLALIEPVSNIEENISNIDEIECLTAALIKKDPDIAVILLGSRAKGTAKKYSDWDIGITRGQSPISGIEYLRLKNIVDETTEDIPRIVDLVNLDAAPLWFLNGINYEPVFLDGNRDSYLYFKGVLYGVKKSGQA